MSTEGLPGGGARPPRPAWKEFRAALESQGFRPSRRFGQNFLLDENTARAIVNDGEVQAGERVLEVGTGCGFLTVHLAHAQVELLTVEVDLRLADVAEPFLAPYPRVTLLRGDVLATKHTLHPEVQTWCEQGPWHMVANLPYAISGPLLAIAALQDDPPLSITVLVQKELGQRLIAAPGTPDYGPLAVACQWAYRGRWLRDVGGASFWPRPKVLSSVMRLERRTDFPRGAERREAMERIRRLFTRRRQTLVRVLGDFGADREALRAHLEQIGRPMETRAESLTPAELADLALGPLWPR